MTAKIDPQRCESGSPECGPVEYIDADGVLLCRACWNGLETETATQRRAREAGLYVVRNADESQEPRHD
jgi:hypothetical protein